MKINLPLVEQWFEKRFGRTKNDDPSYFQEWVQRFKSGNYRSAMDSESRKVWDKVCRAFFRGPTKGIKCPECGSNDWVELWTSPQTPDEAGVKFGCFDCNNTWWELV